MKRARKRRGRGEGSIFQRADGRWAATITIGYDSEGKRRRRTVYGKTKKECQDKLTELQARKLSGLDIDPKRMRLGEYLTEWLKVVASHQRGTTYDSYENSVRLHITPHLGQTQLADLRRFQLKQWLAALESAEVGRHAQQTAHKVLKVALTAAVDDGLIIANPMQRLRRPAVEPRKMVILTEDQARQLISGTRDHRLHALFTLAISTGMRQGELFALQWEDIDLDEGRLSIRHNLEERKGVQRLGEPKTRSSKRTITLPGVALEALRERLAMAMSEGHAGNPRVFPAPSGGWLEKANFRARVWHPIRKQLELSAGVRFHDLRHSAATMMLQRGVNVRVVAEMLGHSTPAVTLNVYAHVMESGRDQAATAMNDVLAG